VKPLASVASNRIEKYIRLIASAALFVSGIEVVANAIRQAPFTSALSTLMLSVVVLSAGLFIVSAVFFDSSRMLGMTHGLAVLVAIWLVPLTHSSDFAAAQESRPWVWWSIGMALLIMGISSPTAVWLPYTLFTAVSWSWVSSQEPVLLGERDAFLDGAYLAVITLAILGLVNLVRSGFVRVDEANSEAIQSSLTQARTDAVERERQRLDALVHDQVLHTLILASKADSTAEKEAAAESAKSAIDALTKAREDGPEPSEVTSLGLFTALERAASKLDSRIRTQSRGASAMKLDPEAAQAMTEASLQAIDNAIQHSRASEISLELVALEGGSMVYTVSDNGTGFRAERVPRSRIGIRTSIKARIESVGGQADIISQPGEGTKVVIRWPSA
jgi:signal transduction histidine kinase